MTVLELVENYWITRGIAWARWMNLFIVPPSFANSPTLWHLTNNIDLFYIHPKLWSFTLPLKHFLKLSKINKFLNIDEITFCEKRKS